MRGPAADMLPGACMLWSCSNREMLSASNSRISTKCPDRILSTIFCGTGASAGERMSPFPCDDWGNWSVGAPLGWFWVNGTEDNSDGGGKAPRAATRGGLDIYEAKCS